MHFQSKINKTRFAITGLMLGFGVCLLQPHLAIKSLATWLRSSESEPTRLCAEQVNVSHRLATASQFRGAPARIQPVDHLNASVGVATAISADHAKRDPVLDSGLSHGHILMVANLDEIRLDDTHSTMFDETRVAPEQIEIDFAPNKEPFVLDVRQARLGSVGDEIRFAPNAKPWDSHLDMFTTQSEPERQPEFVATNSNTIQDNGAVIEELHDLDDTDEMFDPWYSPMENGTPQQLARRVRIRKCLDFYYSRLLNTRDDSPWSIMHHMIAWGSDSQVWVGGFKGKQVSAIGWLCANGPCENERLLTLENGVIEPRIGPGLQGHEGQFLAMLAQARVQQRQPINVDGYEFTVQDLIDQEKRGCVSNSELTFKLIGLAHYLHTDDSWQTADGEAWDIPRLIREEIRQPINGVTCGGTHRLMGLSYAVRRRMQDGLPIDGEFARAAKYTSDFREFAFKLRTPEGSFSTDFFRSARHEGDMNRKLKTTGHILEWLIFSAEHDQLQDPRLLRALDLLTHWLVDSRYFDWDTGPLGHAIRALTLYDERVYGGMPGQRGLEVADNPPWIAPNPNKPKNRAKAAMARQQRASQVETRTINNPARRGMNFLRRGFR